MPYHEIITEVFDQPLPLTYNHKRSEEMKVQFAGISAVFVYDASIEGVEFEFTKFRYKNAWEVHFNNKTNDYSLEIGTTFKGAQLTRLMATVMFLYEQRLSRGNIIRYYAEDAKLRDLYDRTFRFLNRTRYNSRLMRIDVPAFATPYGVVLPATLIQLDVRTLPIPNEKIDEYKRNMLEGEDILSE